MERSEASSSAVNLRKQRMEPKKTPEKRQQMGSLKEGAPLFHDKERPVDSAASQVRSVLG